MSPFNISVRITRTHRCKEGFYLLFNRQRLWFKRHRHAVAALRSILSMQRFRIVSVRTYQAEHATAIARAIKR